MKEITAEFLERLMVEYDPGIDLSEGGPAYVQIVEPTLARVEHDPLEVPFATFAVALLRDRFPDLSFTEGNALAEAVAKPMELLVRPLLDQMVINFRQSSLQNWTQMSEDELDARLTNFFHSRIEGDRAQGTARLYFRNPTTTSVGSGNVFTSKSGLRFFANFPQNMAADTMLANKEGNLYYMSVYLTAEYQGTDYNIGRGDLVAVTGLAQVASVTNLRAFRGGLPKESNEDAVIAAQQAVTQRNLGSTPGIFTRLRSDIAGIRHIRVVGYGDDEMTRDVLKGGSGGEIIEWGFDASVINDGDGDDTSQLVQCPLADFTQLVGPVGVVVNDIWLLTFAGADRLIIEVVSATMVKVSDEITLLTNGPDPASGTDLVTVGTAIVESLGTDFTTTAVMEGNTLSITSGADIGSYKILEVAPGGNVKKLRLDTIMTDAAGSIHWSVPFGRLWYLREKKITLSDIPGGFISESGAEVPDDEVHVGGMVDVYVSGDPDDASVDILAAADQNPLVEGMDLTYVSPTAATSASIDFIAKGVLPSHSLVIEEGVSAGVYRILVVGGNIVIDGTLPGVFANVRFHISDVVDIELSDPREPRISGSDLKVTLGASTAITVPLTNFSDYGVVAGDYIRIVAGPDKGDYQIQELTGTGNVVLVVIHTWRASQVDLVYEIYRKGEAVDLPVVDVDTVELNDSNEEPTGIYVPYGKPVRLEALEPFENVGEGTLASYTGVQLGIVGTEDLTTVAGLVGLQLNLNVGTTTDTVTFTAAAVTIEKVIEEIQAVFRDIAYIYEHNGEKRLALQSIDRLIVVDHNSGANSILGLDITRDEYNDQIVIFSGTTNISDINATTRSVINVTTAPVGYYRVYEINTTYGSGYYYTRAYSVFGTKKFWLSTLEADVVVGNPSMGVVRAYFRDPTYFEVQGPRYKTQNVLEFPWEDRRVLGEQLVTELVATISGATYKFYPDSAKRSNYLPADDDGQPNNGSVGSGVGVTFQSLVTGAGIIDGRSTRIDFLRWLTSVGDSLVVTTYALVGDVDLAAGGLALTDKFVKIRIADYLFTIDFDANDTTITDVIDAINKQTGEEVAGKEIDGANEYLVLESDKEVVIEGTDDTDDVVDILFRPLWAGVNTSNVPSVADEYLVYEVGPGAIYNSVNVKSTSGFTVDFTTKSAIDAVNGAVAHYLAHYDDSVADYHAVDDVTHGITATPYPLPDDAPDGKIYGLWNDLVAQYDLHDANHLGNYHTPPGSQHNTGLGPAGSVADVLSQYPTYREKFKEHVEDITGGGAHAGVKCAEALVDRLTENVDDNNNLHFGLSRRGAQRISPAKMAAQIDDNGFYYMDFEAASEGAGNQWNLAEDIEFVAEYYACYGWWLTTGNEATSYSLVEELWMHLTPDFLPQDKKWDPAEFYSGSGQNYEVDYRRSELVEEVHDYLRSEQNRNEVQNILARHLLPSYIYLAVAYTGGSQISVVEDDLEAYIKEIRPEEALSVYGLAQALSRRSVEDMQQPTTLAALVWESDRELKLYRSVDELAMGIRYALYVGNVVLTRS